MICLLSTLGHLTALPHCPAAQPLCFHARIRSTPPPGSTNLLSQPLLDALQACAERRVLRPQRFDLPLLLFDSVDQHDGELVILHSLDFAFIVVRDQQGVDREDLFCYESQVMFFPALPVESDWTQTLQQRQTAAEGIDILLVAAARRTSREDAV